MATAELLDKRHWSAHKLRLVSLCLAIAFGLLLAALFARSVSIAISYPPSFDGAMNLQVASSIANGDGYRRNYASREAFPHEIQTGAPYILPAAAVFRMGGVGLTQAEVANILYLALLLLVAYLLVRPVGGRALALFATCTVLVIPGLHEYGFYGYGELPALFFALVAITIYFEGAAELALLNAFTAGILLALAFYTKTVMLIGVGCLGACALLEWWSSPDDARRAAFKRLVAAAGGIVTSVLLMESWRASAVGGLQAWETWWGFELRNVLMQAGVGHGFGNFSHSLSEKLAAHLTALSHDYRMSLLLTAAMLLLLFFASGVMALLPANRRGKWTTFAVLTIAAVYMFWWLLITPSAKAWHRRIIDGMICADIGLIMFAALWCRGRDWSVLRRSSQVGGLVIMGLVLALPAMWLVKGSHALLTGQVDDKTCEWRLADASACHPADLGNGIGALMRISDEVRDLPRDAYIFGSGWYSAPRVGLFSGRHLLDINDLPVLRLQAGRPAFLVQGPNTPPSQLQRIRLLYGLPLAQDAGYALIMLDSLRPVPFEPGNAPVQRHITAAEDYPYLRGFNESEGSNGRWLSDDNLVLLVPQAGDHFELDVYVMPVSKYEYPSAPRVSVSFNDCNAPSQVTVPDGVNDMVFPIPDACGISPGTLVNVRIEVDNLVDNQLTQDSRPLSVLAKSLGFAGGSSTGPSRR